MRGVVVALGGLGAALAATGGALALGGTASGGSAPRFGDECRMLGSVPVADDAAMRTGSNHGPAWASQWDYFTNFGRYMPRTHCLLDENGEPDWLWIGGVMALTLGVVVAYLKIFVFWRRSYLEERPADRNTKLMDLAYVFLWCAICGYVMSMVMFVWPAYRLLAVFLVVLNIFSWRFASSLGDLRVSLSAKRLQRELEQHIRDRNIELEALVASRTRELEEARAAAQSASEFKSQFLANMSHEIRTPMNAILGFVDLMNDETLDRAERASHLGTVKRNAEHLLGVINDILDLSKVEAGQLAISPGPVSLDQLIAEVHGLMNVKAREKGLDLRVRSHGPTPTLWADAGRLRQVLVNLVGNAVKFTDVGSVTVDCESHRLGDGRWSIRIDVRDTGIGMDEERLGRLFQPFAQADASITRRFGGTGLGLVISRRLARLMNGDVTVTSEAGRGSCFTLAFVAPECAEHLNAHTAGTLGAAPDLKGRRVLLAEDGPDNQRLLAHYLKPTGLTLVTAENGVMALNTARDNGPFDAVLMDIQMPEMDGYTATARLRDAGFTGPIIALTAHAMSGDRERCLAAGCSHYLTKPVARAELYRVLQESLRAGSAPVAQAAPATQQGPAAAARTTGDTG